MPAERSAGIIFFRNTPEGRRYLVIRSSPNASYVAKLKRIREFWDFSKGILGPGEKGIDAAKREAEEEVGITEFEVAPEFKTTVRYFTRREGKPILKFAALFLAESKTPEVKLSWEHDKYEWLPYEEVRRRLSLPQMKKALESAEDFLNQRS